MGPWVTESPGGPLNLGLIPPVKTHGEAVKIYDLTMVFSFFVYLRDPGATSNTKKTEKEPVSTKYGKQTTRSTKNTRFHIRVIKKL